METIASLLKKAEQFLARKKIEKPRLEAQIIFSKALGLSRIGLYTQDTRPVNKAETNELRNLLVRKADGEPTAYITGSKEFYSREFLVNCHTLIPRPETEELCDLILSAKREGHPGVSILDVATGSGVIGITLALEMKKRGVSVQELVLTDISELALQVAEKNARRHLTENGISYKIIQSDWFNDIPLSMENSFSMIASNPPYILPNEYDTLPKSVKEYEPQIALLASDFTEISKTLATGAHRFLGAGGCFYLEINPGLSDTVVSQCKSANFLEIKKHLDLAKREHFISMRKNDER